MSRRAKACIREFREADLLAVRDLIHQTIEVCYSGVYPARAVAFFKEFHSEVKIMERHLAGKVLVVEQDGSLIGTGTLVGGDIFGVFVHPEFQGLGHGRSLMRELESAAKTTGCRESELSVSLPSRGFYEGLGYEMLEACSIDVGEGQRLDFFKARKPLTRQDTA